MEELNIVMKKEELLKLIDKLPDNAEVVMNKQSYDGWPNFKRITQIIYEKSINSYIIE